MLIGHRILKSGCTWYLQGSLIRKLHKHHLSSSLGCSMFYKGYKAEHGVQIIYEWKMFFRGNKKAFFLPDLITAIWKRVGVPLCDVDEVLRKDPPSPTFRLERFFLYRQYEEDEKI